MLCKGYAKSIEAKFVKNRLNQGDFFVMSERDLLLKWNQLEVLSSMHQKLAFELSYAKFAFL